MSRFEVGGVVRMIDGGGLYSRGTGTGFADTNHGSHSSQRGAYYQVDFGLGSPSLAAEESLEPLGAGDLQEEWPVNFVPVVPNIDRLLILLGVVARAADLLRPLGSGARFVAAEIVSRVQKSAPGDRPGLGSAGLKDLKGPTGSEAVRTAPSKGPRSAVALVTPEHPQTGAHRPDTRNVDTANTRLGEEDGLVSRDRSDREDENVRLEPAVGERDHVRGPLDAPMVLVEYGDYDCPYTVRTYSTVKGLRRRFDDLGLDLCFVFRAFPLTELHEHAQIAAEAAEAAAAQGYFWQMHDRLFKARRRLARDDILRYAREIGLDAEGVERFERDLTGHTGASRVSEDLESGVLSGVQGTPTFFINGVRHDGAHDLDTLLASLQGVSLPWRSAHPALQSHVAQVPTRVLAGTVA